MKIIKASMSHNANTITLLSLTQYNTFLYWRKLLQFALAMLLIIWGVSGPVASTAKTLLLFAGCWMAASADVVPKHMANRIIKAMNGSYPSSDYAFSPDEDFFTLSDANAEPAKIEYSSLTRLVDHKGYLFLFISKLSAYMISVKSVSGGSIDELKGLISSKCGMKWTRPFNILSFRISNIASKYCKKK